MSVRKRLRRSVASRPSSRHSSRRSTPFLTPVSPTNHAEFSEIFRSSLRASIQSMGNIPEIEIHLEELQGLNQLVHDLRDTAEVHLVHEICDKLEGIEEVIRELHTRKTDLRNIVMDNDLLQTDNALLKQENEILRAQSKEMKADAEKLREMLEEITEVNEQLVFANNSLQEQFGMFEEHGRKQFIEMTTEISTSLQKRESHENCEEPNVTSESEENEDEMVHMMQIMESYARQNKELENSLKAAKGNISALSTQLDEKVAEIKRARMDLGQKALVIEEYEKQVLALEQTRSSKLPPACTKRRSLFPMDEGRNHPYLMLSSSEDSNIPNPPMLSLLDVRSSMKNFEMSEMKDEFVDWEMEEVLLEHEKELEQVHATYEEEVTRLKRELCTVEALLDVELQKDEKRRRSRARNVVPGSPGPFERCCLSRPSHSLLYP